jgi:hypothetical protein
MRFFRGSEPKSSPDSTLPALDKIDAVVVSPDQTTVFLIMGYASTMPLAFVQQRLNNYLGFVLDGQMARTQPDLAGKRTQIVLAPDDFAPPELDAFVAQANAKVASEGIEIRVGLEGQPVEHRSIGG